VRFSRFITLIIALPFVLLSACDRGAHPAQLSTPAPDFTISDGRTSVHLADYRGKVVLLNFWATWCAPCIQETPSLIQLHHDRPDLAMIAVSIDEDPDEYKRFIDHRHFDLITVRDPNQTVAKLFRTEMWPETYIIDRKGVIRRKFIGNEDWSDPEVRSFLKSL
jgi:peroxiredoxin